MSLEGINPCSSWSFMSISWNSVPYVDINDPNMYADPYVDINDPGTYFESAQGVPQEQETLASPSMRPQLMGLVAEQYIDRDALALVQRLNSSVLQAGLLHRVRTIGDNALGLTRHIEGLGGDELSAQFVEVIDRIQRLPQAYQQAPLEILLGRSLQEKFLASPEQLCALATLIASRSIKKVEELAHPLNSLMLGHDFSSRTEFLLRFLSVALESGKKSESTNGSEYAATFLRVLAILTDGKRYTGASHLADAPAHFDFLPVMLVLKDMRGRPNDKLKVLSFLLAMSPRLCGKQYEVAFNTLGSLPLKEHFSESKSVFEGIFWRIDEIEANLRSKVATAYIQLISLFELKDRERSLHLMLFIEPAWTYKELTDKFFDALRQFDRPFEDMIEQAIFRVSNTTRARLLLEAFVRYIGQERIETQEVMLTGLLRRVEKALQHGKNFKVDGHCVTALKNGLAALKR